MPKTKCKICGKPCIMGINATVDGCDSCTGVERDKNGCAWYKGATEQTFKRVDGLTPAYTVNREDAFRR